MLEAGSLNRRIQIQSQVGQAGFTTPTDTWTTVYECWANIDIQTSQLLYQTAEFVANVIYRITCRWTSSFVVTPSNRIVYTEPTTGVVHVYKINAILNMKQANSTLVLMCDENDGSS